jgi:hypothetical protein
MIFSVKNRGYLLLDQQADVVVVCIVSSMPASSRLELKKFTWCTLLQLFQYLWGEVAYSVKILPRKGSHTEPKIQQLQK